MNFDWPTHRIAGSGGLALNVVDAGAGDCVVFVHGFPDSSYLWRHQIEALVDAGYRCIAPDARGYGESERPGDVDGYHVEHLVEDVRMILDELEIETAVLVGHDSGAVTTWASAGLMRERVSGLIVLSVGHPGIFLRAGRVPQIMRSWYIGMFQVRGLAERLFRARDWSMARRFLSSSPDVDRYVERWSSDPSALTSELGWYRANATPTVVFTDRYKFPPVVCPTLGVWSSRDLALTEAQMRESVDVVRGPWTYKRLDGVGHWMMLEVPEAVNGLIVDFLQRPGAQ